MAIKKSAFTSGMARKQMPQPVAANLPAELLISHAFAEALPTTDILELTALPPYCKITSIEMIGEGTGATTFTVGFMSGDFGSSDAARTSGTELFNAVAASTKAEASIVALAALATTDTARSIGIRASALVAANAATKLHFRIRYVSGQ